MHVVFICGLPSSKDKDRLRFSDVAREVKDSLAIEFCLSEIAGELTYLTGLKEEVFPKLERVFLDHCDGELKHAHFVFLVRSTNSAID